MDFRLTDEQQAARDLAREFAEREIVPVAAELDQQHAFPREVIAKAQQAGLTSLTIPEEFGGAGASLTTLALASEQFGWGCAGIATSLGINTLTADPIIIAGSHEQKREYLGRMTEGALGAYALTEPAAGSDVAALTTRARRVGDDYVLNGSKIWISNAPHAEFFVVFATTDPAAGRNGISAFVIERDTPGVDVGNPLPKLGQRASHASEIFFNDVVVPSGNRLGNEGDGFLIAMGVFDRSRPMISAISVGVIQRCLDESLGYATERVTMGQPIIRHQSVGNKIAEMGMRAEAARLLTYQAASLYDAGERNTLAASYAKAFAADSAMWAANEAVQIFGGNGYSEEFPVAKLFRDAKLLQIYEGTSEIQRVIMVREIARSRQGGTARTGRS
ncbi:MAG TPA: acyl-CoA dehydrogenase family protein [Thermomicrobiales bacterium]|nr:acyl-CoA dehydrogenase family protein [Thermomicrobiales bacterium]